MTHFRSTALIIALAVLLAPTPGLLSAAPDNTPGMALLGAHVNNNGTINSNSASGVTSITVLGAGQHVVTFDRNITNCIFSGTAAQASTSFVTVSPYVLPTQVRVVVFSDAGALSSADYHVMAFCPR